MRVETARAFPAHRPAAIPGGRASPLFLLGSCVLLAAAPLRSVATDWPHWRGPRFDGTTDERGLPTTWTLAENVAWVADLPGPGAGTPVVWKDRIFVTAADPEAKELLALALDSRTGKALWRRVVSKGEIARTERSNYASPSPTTDGEVVVFFYGNGELAAFDLDGESLWKRNVQSDYGEFAFLWTFSSSPLLLGGKVYLQVLQRDVPVDGRGFEDKENESCILAFDSKTGKALWRRVRPSAAVAESRESFASPVPFERDGKTSLLVIGGDALTAHDPATGEELWRWETWNPEKIGHWRHVVSPVAGGGVVLVCAPKRDPVYAIRPGGSGRLGADAVAWTSADDRVVSSDVPTPAFWDGDFFVLSDVRKSLSRVDAATGKVEWTMRTPGMPKLEASPLVADGKVYLVNFDGDVVVVDARDGKILHEVAMKATTEYPVRSSIVAAQGKLFIRLNRKLYAIGAGGEGR